MKNKIFTTLFTVALGFGIQSNAYAGHGNFEDRVNNRLNIQHEQIEEGIDDGELTRWERKQLLKQHRTIEALSERFLRDGYYSKKERKILKKKLKQASHSIRSFTHNKHTNYASQQVDDNHHSENYFVKTSQYQPEQCDKYQVTPTYTNRYKQSNNGYSVTYKSYSSPKATYSSWW